MKNVLSKSLLCGVLATSFLIINCQKAPSRPIKSGGGDGSGKITALKIGDCTPAAVTALTARDAALKTLKAEADKKPTDVDGKKKLDDLAKDLEAKTKAVSDEITKIKVGNDKADGCKVTDADKKVTTYELPALNAETLKMSKIVQGITGSSTPGVVADDAILRSGDQITIAADLAKALSDAAKSCVSDGKALSGADCDTAVANKAITSCVLTNTDGKAVDANAKAGAVVSDAKMDATSKRNVVATLVQ